MSASKTAEAAAKAIRKSQQKKAEERTDEQVVKDLFKNASAGLSVTSADILLLHKMYQDLLTVNGELFLKIGELVEKNKKLECAQHADTFEVTNDPSVAS